MSATSGEAGGPATTVQVADGVYAYVQPDGGWWINNAGFLVGETGILSIDTVSTAQRAEAYRAAIERVSPLPVRTIVNTHHHGDHTNGNFVFADATIAAHRLCRVEMQAVGLPGPRQAITWDGPADWGDLKSAPPFLTYEDGIDLWVDDLRVEVRHLGGPAHTTNDSIVWVPERSVLFTGDLVMSGCTPFIMNGSLAGSLRALEHLRALQPATVVPGHGPVGGPELLDAVTDYLLFLDDTARRAHSAGLAPLEAARACDLGEYAGLLDRERIAGNLHRALAELDGAEGVARFDRARALADMVAYNGGRLVSHA